MLAKIENKWDIKYYLPQQKVLRKILEKVFIAKKFTQCKTSRTRYQISPNIRFEIPDNKDFRNCVQNMNCFSWIKLIPVLIHFIYWYYDSPFLELLYLPPHLCQILPLPISTPLQHNPHHVLHWFSYFVLPHSITHHHKYWICQTIWQAKLIKFIVKLYSDNNTLWVKHSIHLKAESLRIASLSRSNFQHGHQQLYLPYKLCWILCKMIGFPSFSQTYLYIQPYYIQQPLQSPPKILSSTSANFHLPIPPLLFNKITLTIPTNTHFRYAAAIFNLPVFAYNHASYLHQKIFSLPHPFSQFRLHWRTKGLRNFNLSRLPQNMDIDIRVHNHWFLITQA